MKSPLKTKLYYSISEVSRLTELQPYTLRAWEKEFNCLKPRRARGKNRAYRERDIGIILLIKHLLHRERYTIAGVRRKIKSEPELLRHASENVDSWRTAARHGTAPDSPSLAAADDGETSEPVAATSATATAPAQSVRANVGEGDLKALLETTREQLRALLDEL
jgi:DNA-binding transcriptional MerR regulator